MVVAVTHGMNVDDVEATGRALQARAADIEVLIRDVDRQVGSTSWVGPDAERFKNQWWPEHRRNLVARAKEIGRASCRERV